MLCRGSGKDRVQRFADLVEFAEHFAAADTTQAQPVHGSSSSGTGLGSSHVRHVPHGTMRLVKHDVLGIAAKPPVTRRPRVLAHDDAHG